MSAKLQLDNVTIQFGGLRAVGDLSFSINPGELIGLIGPNGAGKTTVFNLITGVYNPTAGRILFNDIAIPGHKPHQITRLGIARTFQNIRLFPSMSVFDNVRTAMVMHQQHGITHALMRGKGHHDEEVLIEQDILDLLDIFKLRDAAHVECKSLSYGDQRRLEIIRALATKPKLLLLDEPAAGMNPTEKDQLMHLIRFIRDKFDIAVLLVEHDMKVVMGICERIVVIEYGVKIAEGTPEEIRNNPKVIEAYLGEESNFVHNSTAVGVTRTSSAKKLPSIDSTSSGVSRNLPSFLAALGMIVAFFMPWVTILGLGVSGYNLGNVGRQGQSAWLLLILAGACAVTHVTKPTRVLNFMTGAAPFALLLFQIAPKIGNEITAEAWKEIVNASGIGAWLTLICGAVLIFAPVKSVRSH